MWRSDCSSDLGELSLSTEPSPWKQRKMLISPRFVISSPLLFHERLLLILFGSRQSIASFSVTCILIVIVITPFLFLMFSRNDEGNMGTYWNNREWWNIIKKMGHTHVLIPRNSQLPLQVFLLSTVKVFSFGLSERSHSMTCHVTNQIARPIIHSSLISFTLACHAQLAWDFYY